MIAIYLLISGNDYESSGVDRAYKNKADAESMKDALQKWESLRPAYLGNDATDEEYAAFDAADKEWRSNCPLGPEHYACDYYVLQEIELT